MASYRKTSTGWKATVSKRTNGKLSQTSKRGFRTKNEAIRWAAAIEAEIDGVKRNKRDVVFADYFKDWYQTYKKPKISLATLDRYKIAHKVIANYFKLKKLSSITRKDYQQFINQFGATHAKATVLKTNNYVRACLKSAIADDIILKDFTQGVEIVHNPNATIKVDYLSVEEIKVLLAECKSNLRTSFTSRYMIITAIYTGMRLGEIMALTWEDIDFDKKTISINKTWDYAHNTGFKPTKNEASIRVIRVNHKLLNIISSLRENKTKMVFENTYHKIPTPTAVNKALRELLNKTGINAKNFHFHSLRHSHVAYLLYQGVDLYAISKRLGHSDMTTTSKQYAYLIAELEQRENNRISELMDQL
ncbi:tyrosine-type recombinase/integrase [Ligilactobacillus equi]|uniref:Integrase family protein n=1 Tax=Ligilactobacillus equi DPC 6820 TaxID=1392007 RepID=V7HYL3_9LACO|nr:tyrosine-type recombinase/integrase [Ligilactobacillus equi]ETA74313.1 integrase family protein [Ligilactobacillus equi DPC 6820]